MKEYGGQEMCLQKCQNDYYNGILDDLVGIINTKGLIIGSRRFGGANGDSDWDYIISDIWKDRIFYILNETEIDWWMITSYGDSNMYSICNIKFEYEGILYNVLVYEDSKFKKIIDNIHWFNTNGSVLDTLLKSEKKARAYIFNGFLHYLFGPDPKPFECNNANRIPCIKMDLDNSMMWLQND